MRHKDNMTLQLYVVALREDSPIDMFVVDQRLPAIYHVSMVTSQTSLLPLQGLQQPYAVDYDQVNKLVSQCNIVILWFAQVYTLTL